ncbi:MAG: hypothetical protein WCT50_05080 [Patescibacteria group bacterium]
MRVKLAKRLINFQKKLNHIPPMAHVIFFTILILGVFVILIFDQGLSQGLITSIKNVQIGNSQSKVVDKDIRYNIYGDHFVNDLSINTDQTTFYYDRAATAFTFLPLYDFKEAGVGASEIVQPDDVSLVNGALVFAGKKISLPADLINLKNIEILNVTSYKLGNNWLVGIVFNLNEKESGRAYLFNGRGFINLDPKNLFPFDSRVGFPGAHFGFGGEVNNFVVLYGAYDLLGYQVVDEKLIDLKQFFSLRISDGGFSPLVIKQEMGDETNWYICSQTEGKPRFVKLWQNGSKSVKGVLSLTESLFGEKGIVDSAWCSAGKIPGEIEINIKQDGVYSKKIFQDNGFSQDKDYVLLTNNLFKDSGEILKAKFDGLIACDDGGCGAGVLNNSLSFSISGEGSKFKKISLGQEVIFPEATKNLYWKITAKTKNNRLNYSPWIDGLTSISYSWK